jgi:hypothetical protein
LVILAASTSRSGFFHEKTVSYILVSGQLVSSTADGTGELAGATAGAASPPAAADPADQSRSSHE